MKSLLIFMTFVLSLSVSCVKEKKINKKQVNKFPDKNKVEKTEKIKKEKKVQECKVSKDCKDNLKCKNNKCLPECSKDEECDNEKSCIDERCKFECNGNNYYECGGGSYSKEEYECIKHKCKLQVECSTVKDCKSGEICIENICLEDLGSLASKDDKIIISDKKDIALKSKKKSDDYIINTEYMMKSGSLHLMGKKKLDSISLDKNYGEDYLTLTVNETEFKNMVFINDRYGVIDTCKNNKTGLEEAIIITQSLGSSNGASLYFLYYDKEKKKIMVSIVGTSGDIIERPSIYGLIKIKNKTVYCNWRKRMKDEKMIDKVMRVISIPILIYSRYDANQRHYFELTKSEDNKKTGMYSIQESREIKCGLYKRLLRNKWVFKRKILDNKNWNVKFIYYNGIESSEKHTGAVIVYNKKNHTCRNIYQYRFSGYDDYKENGLYSSLKLKSTHLKYIKLNQDKNIKNYFLVKLPQYSSKYHDYLFHLSENGVEFYKD